MVDTATLTANCKAQGIRLVVRPLPGKIDAFGFRGPKGGIILADPDRITAEAVQREAAQLVPAV